MLGTLQAFNREVASGYGCQLDIGVGINSGDVVAGLVGSEDRQAYTAVGDDVNLASRLEGLSKLYGAKIIVSGATLAEIRATAPDALSDLATRELDRVRVKGRRSAVSIYEVLLRHESPSELAPQLDLFDKARACMLEADFDTARIHAESVLTAWPHDLVARSLLVRCEVYARDPGLFEREYEAGVRILTAK
jgi:adenylate cyclase